MAACDVACQRNKQLTTLLTSLQEATVNKGTDPEAYQQARVRYYTLKEGQGWLQKERERVAKLTVQPIVDKYKKDYAAAQQPIKHTQTDEVGDEEEARFIHKQIQEERNKAGVQQRLMELTVSSDPTMSWIPFAINILIALLSLVIVYLLFTKFSVLKSYVTSQTTTSTL